jgi:UDP-N-acetylmuramate dehydrogenase
VRGLVIHNRAEGSRVDDGRYVAESGVPMARAATETQKAGLTGLEFGLAIPGTVGGAVWANAGAHESDIATVLESARVLDASGSEVVLEGAGLAFDYRDSRLKHTGPDEHPEVVLDATFRLEPADAATIKERLDDIRRWRQAHQPLGIPSAGSVFRNPEGTSAGKLIDEAGLKGLRIGGATVSVKHANFIVNDQKGSAADVRRVAERVRAEVRQRNGVELRFEIEFVGDWSDWTSEEER